MGNNFEIDLSKYNCSCIEKEEGCFLDFLEEMKKKEPFNFFTSTPQGDNDKASPLKNITPHSPNSFYSPRTLRYQNEINNLNINQIKSQNETHKKKKNISLNLFDYSESDFSRSNNESQSNYNENNGEQDREEEDIKDLNSKTDYFQLAKQISEAINELKMSSGITIGQSDNKINNSQGYKTISDDEQKFSFEFAIKNAGRAADKICFNDIVGLVKKISDINSEVSLTKERIFLGIVNKFKKERNPKYLLNFEDVEKIIEIPHFDEIKKQTRLKLGHKFNNSKFKYSKFVLEGSFPNEILIWKLISQNTEKITNIINENYYCCIVLLYQSKHEEENKTIMYLVNKPIL